MKSSFPRQIQHKLDHKTKPPGALGTLETLAFQVASVQKTLTPELIKPHIIVFAGSHGIASAGVSAYPSEVTAQMVLNFIHGGAAINVFTRQHGINLLLVDAGVDYEFEQNEKLVHAKVNYGTKNFLEEPAMTQEECEQCIKQGAALVREIKETGCNVIGFGEMGIGNTSSASLIMSKLLAVSVEDCVGKGTGLDDAQVVHKTSVLNKALEKHAAVSDDPLSVLQTFGGFGIAMRCGAMQEAAKQKMIVLADGFIASASYLCALKLDASVQEFAVFCHQCNERGYRLLMQELNADPILKFNMRRGEGTVCALAYLMLQSAVAFFYEMASFETAGVSQKAS
jgi:nicotinate-nucleotide--dimethylbenzimidazole phosphoribosyltransferase